MDGPQVGSKPYVLSHLSADSNWGRLPIFWLAVVAVIFTGMGVAYLLSNLRAQALENGLRLTKSFAMVIEEQTSRTLLAADIGLQLTIQSLDDLQTDGHLTTASANRVLQQGRDQMPFISHLTVIDATGRVVYGTDSPGIGLDVADRSYFQHYINHPEAQFSLGPLVQGRTTGEWTLTATRPLATTNNKGKFNGIVVAAIKPQRFSDKWGAVDLGAQGSITLFGHGAQLLTRSPTIESVIGQYFPDLPLFADHLPHSASGVLNSFNTFDKVHMLIAYQTVGTHPDLVVAVGASYATLLAPWIQLAITVATIWASGSVVILVLCFFLNRAWQLKSDNEVQLRNLAQRFALSTDAAGVGVWDWHIDSDTWYASPPYYTQLGYTPEEGKGDREQWLRRVHPDDRAAVAEKIDSVLSKRADTYEYEARVLHANGEYRWVNVIGRVLARDNQAKPMRLMGIRTDITNRKAQQAQLLLSERMFAQSLEGIVVTDFRGLVVSINEAFTEVSGYAPDDIVGQHPTLFSSKRHDDEFHAALNAAVAAHGTWQGELWILRKDGSERPLWLKVNVVRDNKGRLCNFVGMVSDISEQKASQEKINWLSHFDQVSGLPNRLLLQDRTARALSMVERASQPLCMMMVSMGHLKTVNDTRGHTTADRLLQQAALRLTESAREQDTIGHLGGNEFVLVLPDTHTDGGAHLATKLLGALGRPYVVDGEEFTLTVGIGISVYPDSGNDFNALLQAAELAMHRAQAAGSDTFQFFSESVYQNVVAQDQMTKALRSAVALSQLHMVYQPLADLQTGQICGMEALLRWNHPQLGAVSPAQFIPLAEMSGLIRGIGEWVLRQVCKDILAWQANGIRVPPVAVNVSPIQLHDADFAARVQAALSEFQIDPSLIYLEVTESSLMEDVDRSGQLLKELRGMGVCLSLDDFGTGYSSLSYLKRFPFNKVKIDQSFVRDVDKNHADVVIVQVIVSMAHGLGLTVIAEGVETESQCEIMRNAVCDEIQGYLFSRPVSAATIETLIKQPLQLPQDLLRFRKPKRTLLLVDDEANVVSSLKRVFRKDGHHILTASSGAEGLDILAKNKVDVIISDQRMPGMTGVEFLRAAKAGYPDTIRIVLSGYTELQSVTDAINEGAIYRFLTKPWEDEQLRDHIRKAFEHKELQEENQQLNFKIRTANQELTSSNMQLNAILEKAKNKIALDENSLAIYRDALECISLPIIGVDNDGVIAFVNEAADQLLYTHRPLLGEAFSSQLASVSAALAQLQPHQNLELQLGAMDLQVSWSPMGEHSSSRGKLITLLHKETT